MIHNAFLEIRILGWEEKSERAADLADAFHNLPIYLESEDFNFNYFRQCLESFHRKHPANGDFDYIKMLEKVINNEDLD